MREFHIAVFILQLINVLNSQILPKDIKKCHFGDSKCIIASVNDLIKRYPKGIPDIGMKPIDIVDVPNAEIWNNNEQGGVWFKFKLFNQVIYGFENTTITEIKGFGKEPTASNIEIHGEIPSLIHKGNYTAKGRVWFIEFNSTGASVSDFQKFRFVLKLKVISEYRKNKLYLKIYELVPVINLNRWILWLDEFFKENTDLTIAVNKVFNENWLEFWNETEPSILNTFKSVFTDMIEVIFNKIPYDDMFLKDEIETG